MNLSDTLQKFIASSKTTIVNLTNVIEENEFDMRLRPCAFREEQNEKYKVQIKAIKAEIQTAQDTLNSL